MLVTGVGEVADTFFGGKAGWKTCSMTAALSPAGVFVCDPACPSRKPEEIVSAKSSSAARLTAFLLNEGSGMALRFFAPFENTADKVGRSASFRRVTLTGGITSRVSELNDS